MANENELRAEAADPVTAARPTPSVDAISTIADPARYRALERRAGSRTIDVLDQRALPHAVVALRIADAETAATAIRDMVVRGAPLIGAVGAYGLALALDADPSDEGLVRAHAMLDATRPTAVNLRWALDRVRARVEPLAPALRADAAWMEADAIRAEDVAINAALGRHGVAMLRVLAHERERPLNVMTHCNAGALATCGHGTATAPVFLAHAQGLPLHVWVSETRPRMQGANLTAWELAQRGVPHTLVVDSASGLLMRRGDVDVVIVGADRVARNGDTCNKIGTYDKALAAADNGVPFYVALPSPTIDWRLASGDAIPIEARGADEVLSIAGRTDDGGAGRVAIAAQGTRAMNYAFDVTPARLVSGYITERGIARDPQSLRDLLGDPETLRDLHRGTEAPRDLHGGTRGR
jgi:methylthioribose-1-phosphate isomerase